MQLKSTCELLLPVGNLKMCMAAIHNGADAIYVGMPEFNARGRSADHSFQELEEIIELCHLYGVKVNLAFNVVIFEDELPRVIELIEKVIELAPDALIVQDLGLVRLIKSMAPKLVIHASTQMTITNYEAMMLLEDLDIKRFVLGREVSIKEIEAIRAKTDKELEVFVHGALCVAYSGQCFTSESIGGRSANRGQCAQSCRFEYEMLVDGKTHQLVDQKYLVSPQDLCGIAQIPQLLNLKVNSFKVEGRLKTPEYVASAARNYRQALDRSIKGEAIGAKKLNAMKVEMGKTFSRGFFSGWLNGVDHQNLVNARYSSHRGVLIGHVLKIGKLVTVRTTEELKKGEGILFSSINQNQKIEVGGKIIELKLARREKDHFIYDLTFHRSVDLKLIKINFEVYLNSDPELSHALEQTFEDKNLKKKIPLIIKVKSTIDNPLEVSFEDDGHHVVTTYSNSLVTASIKKESAKDLILSELASLSSTIYQASEYFFEGDDHVFIHQKEIKQIRRTLVEKLNIERMKREKISFTPFDLKAHNLIKNNGEGKARLNILIRAYHQVDTLISIYDQIKETVGVVILDYEFGKDFSPSVIKLKEAGYRVGIATTRILKPNEYYNFKIIERANPDVILIRNLGALYYFQNKNFELMGDFSLNVTNSITKDYLLTKKLKSVCASYDLSFHRLSRLLKQSKAGEVEVTIHQCMPSFHMEHCVFAAFLSKGHSYKDCGKPCEKHHLELKDQFGNYHYIYADQECRNTMFNAEAQTAGRKIKDLLLLGVTEFRFEALKEADKNLSSKILGYVNLLKNPSEDNIDLILKSINTQEKYGLGEGTLGFDKEYKNRKKNH